MIDKKIQNIYNEIEDIGEEIEYQEEELNRLNKDNLHKPYPRDDIEMLCSQIDFELRHNLMDSIKMLKLKQEILSRDINILQYNKQLIAYDTE